MHKTAHLLVLLAALLSASCTSTLISHRMKAAQRKLLETHRLQKEGQWDAALDMSGRLQGSVTKSVQSRPIQSTASGARADLRPLLAAWESGPLTDLQSALKKHDPRRSQQSLVNLRQQCITCHTVIGKTDLQLPALD